MLEFHRRFLSGRKGLRSHVRTIGRAVLIGAGFFAVLGAGDTALARDWPTQVRAVYNISFNGFDIGEFMFTSRTNGDRYAMTGEAELSAMFGAFKWSGRSKSSGLVRRGRPAPGGYDFKYRANSKSGYLNMDFGGNQVTKVASLPRIKTGGGRVPVSDDHLKNVFDPLSAVMAMTVSQGGEAGASDACSRRVPIFDGKQRFDLVLSPKRQVRLDTALGVGLAREALVCKIKYVPVSGHKMNQETEYMMANNDIEIWLVPVADAGIYVPYRVVLPTIAGPTTLTTKSLRIDGQAGKQIAQVR